MFRMLCWLTGMGLSILITCRSVEGQSYSESPKEMDKQNRSNTQQSQAVPMPGGVMESMPEAPRKKGPLRRLFGRMAQGTTNTVAYLTSPEHRREPAGCPNPAGCGNVWTDFKFMFGSCKQYFGTGDSAQGCWNRTTVPSPYPQPYPYNPYPY